MGCLPPRDESRPSDHGECRIGGHAEQAQSISRHSSGRLSAPIEASWPEDGTIDFRSRLRTVQVPAGDITSITTGTWYDPNRFQAVVRHKGGKLTLINQFADFQDFLATLRELNPAVEIKGF